jgi:AraC-like DNA-binding protein
MPAAFWQCGGAVTRQLSSLLNACRGERAQAGSPGEEGGVQKAGDADASLVIRPHWSHAVASVLQPVVGELFELDVADFVEVCRRLARRIPGPLTVPERVMLKHQLMEFAFRVGDDFHAIRHQVRPSACGFLPIESAARVWLRRDTDPRMLLTEWAVTYAAFTHHHQMPSMVKAGQFLRQRSSGRPEIASVARQVGMSRSSFVKAFVRAYGLTPMEYHTRVRLQHFIRELRESHHKVSAAAEAVGYKSEKIYAVLKKITRLHPSEVRRLSAGTLNELMDGPLQIDLPKLARARSSISTSSRCTATATGRAWRDDL